jgi:hypothetical protein
MKTFMDKLKSFVFFAFAFLGATSAVAAAEAVECNSCTGAQLYNRALNSGVGAHLFYDLTLGQISAWQTTREPAPGGKYLYGTEEISVPVIYQTIFNNLKTAVKVYGRAAVDSTITINPSSSWPGFPERFANYNGYQVALTGAAQNEIGRWLENFNSSAYSSFFSALEKSIEGLEAAALTLVFNHDVFSITYNVTLKDGSVVTFDWKAGESAKMTKAVDKNLNPIPLALGQVSGHYLFTGSPNGLTDWLSFMESMGVPVDVNPAMYTGTVTVGCVQLPTQHCAAVK